MNYQAKTCPKTPTLNFCFICKLLPRVKMLWFEKRYFLLNGKKFYGAGKLKGFDILKFKMTNNLNKKLQVRIE